MSNLLEQVSDKAEFWLESDVVDNETKLDIKRQLEAKDPKELIDNFYKDLEFGTGGLRGIMGAGSNCMNRYTLGKATQGLANYLNKSFPQGASAAIAYDSRLNSNYFATTAAEILSANGIKVYLFDELRPTPLLSFAIRYLNCSSGIVITASHNPKEYNGYKVYWNDGAQVVPPHDKNIIAEVNAIESFDQIKFDRNEQLITPVPPEVEQAYYDEVKKRIPRQEVVKKHQDIPLVYSSIHGAGITMVPQCLKIIGFTNLSVVEAQEVPDGNFPTVTSPNPEERSAMEMVIAKGVETGATMVMATDPDTDRVGIGIRNDKNEFILLNGNQAFSLMMQFIMQNIKEKKNAYIAKTIVTTELVDTMAKNYGVECYNTLTGFKYIAELMGKLEGKKNFVAAGEESYGYMVGDFLRDKDAVSACAFFAAMAACAADEGKSLYDSLVDMHVEHGFYKESLINVTKKGQQGEQEIKAIMERLRNNPPSAMAHKPVIRILDYLKLEEHDLNAGSKQPLDFPKSDVLQFYLDDGSKISVRPSGTEPKIKFYISVNATVPSRTEYDTISRELDQRIDKIDAFLKSI